MPTVDSLIGEVGVLVNCNPKGVSLYYTGTLSCKQGKEEGKRSFLLTQNSIQLPGLTCQCFDDELNQSPNQEKPEPIVFSEDQITEDCGCAIVVQVPGKNQISIL